MGKKYFCHIWGIRRGRGDGGDLGWRFFIVEGRGVGGLPIMKKDDMLGVFWQVIAHRRQRYGGDSLLFVSGKGRKSLLFASCG